MENRGNTLLDGFFSKTGFKCTKSFYLKNIFVFWREWFIGHRIGKARYPFLLLLPCHNPRRPQRSNTTTIGSILKGHNCLKLSSYSYPRFKTASIFPPFCPKDVIIAPYLLLNFVLPFSLSFLLPSPTYCLHKPVLSSHKALDESNLPTLNERLIHHQVLRCV